MELNEKEISNIYKEVYEVIKYLPDYQKKLIPQEFIDNLAKKCNNDYEVKIDFSKEIEEQDISLYAKGMILEIYREFFITDNEQEKLKYQKFDVINERMIEENKRKKYNPDVFALGKASEDKKLELIKYEDQTFFQKIKSLLKRLLKK